MATYICTLNHQNKFNQLVLKHNTFLSGIKWALKIVCETVKPIQWSMNQLIFTYKAHSMSCRRSKTESIQKHTAVNRIIKNKCSDNK